MGMHRGFKHLRADKTTVDISLIDWVPKGKKYHHQLSSKPYVRDGKRPFNFEAYTCRKKNWIQSVAMPCVYFEQFRHQRETPGQIRPLLHFRRLLRGIHLWRAKGDNIVFQPSWGQTEPHGPTSKNKHSREKSGPLLQRRCWCGHSRSFSVHSSQ